MPGQKALIIKEAGAPFTLSTDFPIPKPGKGELLIKIKAAALNPVDWKQQKYNFFISAYPAVLGFDIAGDVAELGEGVSGYAKGDKVFTLGFVSNDTSSFQEYAVIPADIVGKIPANIDYGQAATIPLGYVTAAVGLLAAQPVGAGLNPTFDPKVSFAGQPAFVFGGSSSVGQYAIQILKSLGYSPIITYASAKHTAHLKSLGATHVIDRASTPLASLPAEVLKLAGGAPIKIAYDAISEDATRDATFAVLGEGGIAISVAQGEERSEGGKKFISIFGSTHAHREFGALLWKALPGLVEAGIIVPNRVEKVPHGLAGVVDALKKLEEGKVSGEKLVFFTEETT